MNYTRWILPLCLMLMVGMMAFAPMRAQASVVSGSGQCTSFSTRLAEMNNSPQNTGILSDIYLYIKDVVGTATQRLFSAFTENSAYQNAVFAAITLMVVIYGIGFTIGIVQASFGTTLIRLVKIGFIATIVSKNGWIFFSEYIVSFFADGTDDLIKGVMAIGTGNSSVPADATPFYQLDNIATFVLQPDTIIAVMGSTFTGGPFGMMMGGLMGFAVWAFFKLVLNALQKYAICYVARALILGVAPIFIVFLLFDKTKNLFMGWVNVLINLSLQPILLFTFLSFFIVLIQSATTSMFSTELCWTPTQGVQGSTNPPSFWKFASDNGSASDLSQYDWQGSISCRLNGGTDCKPFPINIIDILSFLILVYIAQRFATVVERISTELSNAVVNLDASGRMDQYLQQKSQQEAAKSGGAQGNAGGAPPPAPGSNPKSGTAARAKTP